MREDGQIVRRNKGLVFGFRMTSRIQFSCSPTHSHLLAHDQLSAQDKNCFQDISNEVQLVASLHASLLSNKPDISFLLIGISEYLDLIIKIYTYDLICILGWLISISLFLSPPLFATFNFTLFPRWIKLPCFDLKSQSDTITSRLYQEKNVEVRTKQDV